MLCAVVCVVVVVDVVVVVVDVVVVVVVVQLYVVVVVVIEIVFKFLIDEHKACGLLPVKSYLFQMATITNKKVIICKIKTKLMSQPETCQSLKIQNWLIESSDE